MRKKYYTLISISIAILFWFFDSFIHHIGYGEQAFEIIPSDSNELWMRCVIVVLIVAFGVFADHRTGHDKTDIYMAMLNATNHILKNHLQNMLVFRNAAENCKDFDKDLLNEYDQMIDKTVREIKNLENIQEPSKANIEDRYLPK